MTDEEQALGIELLPSEYRASGQHNGQCTTYTPRGTRFGCG